MNDTTSPETMTTRAAVRRWTHAGLDCAMIDSGIGFVNGYVRLPEGHFARGMGYDQINRAVSVHGGLTYGSDAEGWVGFDTGHSGDRWPGIPSKYPTPPTEWDRAWDFNLLAAEVESLADQLAPLTSLPDPESAWDCTEDEFQALLRDARAWREHVATAALARADR